MLVEIKLASCVVLFFLALGAGRWPERLASSVNSLRTISLANCFAAGVFMGAGLIHTLADSNALLSQHTDYPLAFALACLGFFLVFGFDRILGHGGEVVSPYILAMVLGIHSLIAGVAFGLEQDLTGCLILLAAILAHKGSAAFALGASLVKSGVSQSTLRRTLVIFAFSTPFGILIGSFLSNKLAGGGADWLEGIFDALAAGTFLYVAIMEILAEEFAHRENHRAKYFATLVGLCVMVALALFS